MNYLYFWSMISVLLSCSARSKDTSVVRLPVVADTAFSIDQCKKCLLLSEQSRQSVAIADVSEQRIKWEWRAEASNVKPPHVKWFTNISDAKLVYNGKYVLASASGGGIALIRIADRKTVFYAYAGGNTHSIEVLPDGNIVSSSSTGNYMTVFHVDTLSDPEQVYKKNIPIEFGHNVVWDKKRQLLWTAAMNKLKAYQYNFNCTQPDLSLVGVVDLPGTEAHDLFPVYGTDSLWITNTTDVYQFDTETKKLVHVNLPYKHVKSISSGPQGFPVVISYPKEQWWTDEIFDLDGKRVFYQRGLKIYKARWLVSNLFSYDHTDNLKLCK